jgi:uncharacterized protein (DUF1697 family)
MRYVVLLRAVNVGGRNRVPMAAFRALLTGLGHENVSTFIQSGNGLFSSDRDDMRALEGEIEAAIAGETGVQTTAFIRSGTEMASLVERNPFGEVSGLHVSFLSDDPAGERVAALDPAQFEPDAFRLGPRAMYLVYPNGTAGSILTNAVIERRLGVRATARNWNTVTRLMELSRE